MSRIIRDIVIRIEHSGKRVSVAEVDGRVTAKELFDAVGTKTNLPAGTNGVLIRKLTYKPLLPTQTLDHAGIKDGEVLIADCERSAGGSLEFYADGKVKRIETEPEETPYLAEILREIRLLQMNVGNLSEQVATVKAEIRQIRDSTIVISGRDTTTPIPPGSDATTQQSADNSPSAESGAPSESEVYPEG